MQDGDPINPQRVAWELSNSLRRLHPVGRLGVFDHLVPRDLRLRKGMRASLSGTLATMGPAVPYSIAAKFAYPDRR